jgi:hypothetical protein
VIDYDHAIKLRDQLAAFTAPGTVFTFVKDLTFLGERWADRRPGIHFVVIGLSESGYTFSAANTSTGRTDDLMAESWVFNAARIVGRLPSVATDRR